MERDIIGWSWQDWLPHVIESIEQGDFEMSEQFQPDENIWSESCDDVPSMPPEVLALYISEPGTIDEPPRAADIWQNVEDYEDE